MVMRAALGLGEAGGFPAAIKATAEYFPKKERALATGIFNSGTNIGALITPILVAWILGSDWGSWQWVFVIVGGTNLPWLIFWFWLYEIPSKQKRLSKREYEYILSDNEPEVAPSADPTAPAAPKVKWYVEWGKLMTYRQTWSFAIGKFMTDGVWWFFLFWLPAYMTAVYSLKLSDMIWPLAVFYTMTCIGSIGGGAFPMYFINKGYEPYAGRMLAMMIIAVFPLVVLIAQPLGYISYWVPIILIGVGASAHQAWSANLFTTVSDMFPKKSVGSVVGIGGMAGGVGGIMINKIAGWLFDSYRTRGIGDFWTEIKSSQDFASIASVVQNAEITNRGEIVNLGSRVLSGLSAEAKDQMLGILNNAGFTEAQFISLVSEQTAAVQDVMSTAYMMMFIYCAIAYILAWAVMKTLVPKHKPITD